MTQTAKMSYTELGGPKPSIADDVDKRAQPTKAVRFEVGLPATVVPAGLLGTTITFPSKFSLGYLRDGRLRVVEPISVAWTVEDDQVVAEATELNEYGEGDTIEEAIKDLQASISELFFELDEERDRLGADLQRVYETLTRKLRRVDAANGE